MYICKYIYIYVYTLYQLISTLISGVSRMAMPRVRYAIPSVDPEDFTLGKQTIKREKHKDMNIDMNVKQVTKYMNIYIYMCIYMYIYV